MAPHKSLMCEQVLDEEGVLHLCDLAEFRLDLIPLENDVLSLEMEHTFRECKLDGNLSSLEAVTQSVMKLQRFFGTIPNVKSLGPLGRDVSRMMCRARAEALPEHSLGPEGSIDTLILLDRSVDLVSPLVTPLTYEGLIDELIGVRNSIIKVSRAIADGDKADGKGAAEAPGLVSLALNSNDKLYSEVADALL